MHVCMPVTGVTYVYTVHTEDADVPARVRAKPRPAAPGPQMRQHRYHLWFEQLPAMPQSPSDPGALAARDRPHPRRPQLQCIVVDPGELCVN